MVTVEQPVTLVTHSSATRRNGTCCNPADPTDCTLCPDDPRAEFKLYVCFRPGFVRGYNTDMGYCPLGVLETVPNKSPGSWWHLTAHPEAASLPRAYSVRQSNSS